MSAPHRTCSCGRPFTHEEWCALPILENRGRRYCGEYEEDGRTYATQLRNCPTCHSTLGETVVIAEVVTLGLADLAQLLPQHP